METVENSRHGLIACNRLSGLPVCELMTPPTDEDMELDQQWREVFGQPLPMLGAAGIARKVLQQYQDQASDSATASWTRPM